MDITIREVRLTATSWEKNANTVPVKAHFEYEIKYIGFSGSNVTKGIIREPVTSPEMLEEFRNMPFFEKIVKNRLKEMVG